MPATDTVDFEREFEELVRDLRALPTAAPPELRERVRQLGEPEPRRTRFSLPSQRRSLLVLAPVCLLAVLGAAVAHGLLSSSQTGDVVAQQPLEARKLNPSSHDASGESGSGVFGAATTPTDFGRTLGSPGVPTPSPTRHQDYEADVRIRVRDLDTLGKQTAEAMRVTRELGGYVASLQQGSATGASAEADLVLRVPVANVERAMIRLSGLGTVLEQHVSIVDLEQTVQQQRNQIRALKLRIVRLIAALKQPLPEDVRLRLQFQLDDAKHALARATGASKATLRQGALSRIGLVLTTEHTVAATHHRGRIGRAATNAVDFLAAAGAIALLVLIVISPVLVVAALWWYGLRTWRRREERRLLAEA